MKDKLTHMGVAAILYSAKRWGCAGPLRPCLKSGHCASVDTMVPFDV
jgi:hypothetical protein